MGALITKVERRLELIDNAHPNTDGSPWGWIVVQGTKNRVATYSGYKEKEMCKHLVDINNHLLEAQSKPIL